MSEPGERQQVRVSGTASGALADVQATAPVGTEQALVTRNIDVAQGSTTDLPAPFDISNATVVALLKRLLLQVGNLASGADSGETAFNKDGLPYQDIQVDDEQNLITGGADPMIGGGLSPWEGGTPLPVAPAGIERTGPQSGNLSFPVVLAAEQWNDRFIVSAPNTPNRLGGNALAPLGAAGDAAALDCLPYRSISFQTTTDAGVTVGLTFLGSNDGQHFVPVAMYDAANMTAAPVTSVAQSASTTRFFVGPVQFRWFMAQVSQAVAGGSVTAFTRLSMAPFLPSNYTVNIGNWGGQTVGNDGIDVTGALAVTGLDPMVPGERPRPVIVRMVDIGARDDGLVDILPQLLLEAKAQTHYIRELAFLLNAGRPQLDEPSEFMSEVTVPYGLDARRVSR